jgi:hypothetical protein
MASFLKKYKGINNKKKRADESGYHKSGRDFFISGII